MKYGRRRKLRQRGRLLQSSSSQSLTDMAAMDGTAATATTAVTETSSEIAASIMVTRTREQRVLFL